jgi:exonuclease-1
MRHHGIEPYIVFDGGPLPAKKKTEVSREKYVNSTPPSGKKEEKRGC